MRLTEALLAHAATLRYEDLSAQAIDATRVFVMDSLAVGMSGTGPQLPLAQVVRDAAFALGEGTSARAWVTGERLPATGAAMLNGYLVHGQEFDCVHMPAVVHPMAVILPALVAAAEARANQEQAPVDGRTLITAVNVAVDVATLLGISARAPMRFFRPAMCGALGAAAGIARLYDADASTLHRAVSLAYCQLPGTMQAHVEGSPALAMQVAMASRAAVTSWELARRGFPPPMDVLEGRFGYLPLYEGEYDTGPALAELAAREPQLLQVSHKMFPTGGAAHAGQDMLMELRDREGLRIADIESIELQAPPLVHRLVARPWKEDMAPSYARLCLPYLLATVMLDGRVGLDAYGAERLSDPRRADLAGRVRVVPNGSEDPNALAPQSMTVTTRDGRILQAARDAVIGSPARPLTRGQQLDKFNHCLDHAALPFDAQRRQSLLTTLDRLEALADVRDLVDLLIIEPT
ncbi:MmgE/PrpD family protein [Luteimonas qiangzhengi]|uniref:MmgE/PrpD family protein n=1 Tax=Luteimonas sp. MJ146 TaxID=3129240 RepID=UPI0031BB41F5